MSNTSVQDTIYYSHYTLYNNIMALNALKSSRTERPSQIECHRIIRKSINAYNIIMTAPIEIRLL